MQTVVTRAFPVAYATDVEATARFWERLGFVRHFQLPPEGDPGYVGLRSEDSAAELAVTDAGWAQERYGLPLGDGPRVEMYLYADDLDRTIADLTAAAVPLLREAEEMPWGERIATVADPDGNPVTICQAR